MSVKFCSIASGSSGNSIYVGTEQTHILIDAGLSGKSIVAGLDVCGLKGDKIDAIFITHEHIDHIKGAGILSRKFDVPIYATWGTWEKMEPQLGKILPKNKQVIFQGENCIINDICVKPFEIPHDAVSPVGYSIFAQDYKMTIATDLGHITDTIKENIIDSHILLLESNHDEDMLLSGSYPWALKQRVLGERGHISNHTAGKLLSDIVTNKMRHIFLGHLSAENNRPKLAYETVEKILNKNNIKLGSYLKMEMASRYQNSSMVIL